MELQIDRVPSPIGLVLLVTDDTSLVSLDFEGYESRMHALLAKRYGAYRLAESRDPLGASGRVAAYFAGNLEAVDDIPVETGGTAFQREVWQGLRRIRGGTVTSYGKLAATLGRPSASRAVGYANSLNPVAIVLPCHRVIGGNRDLTGYAGGLDRKRWLLAHERAVLE
ncbi:MAG: methylated-DNA--[protein]-cysteine S-methyltransferase, partial [Aliidongia sp.]